MTQNIPYKGKVLVLGEDIRAPLTVTRSLGRKGIEVHTGWCEVFSGSARSKYTTKHHDIPLYNPNDNGWIEAFKHIMNEEKYDLVIPCDDRSMIPLQKHKQDLLPFGKIYLLDDETFKITQDKWLTTKLADSLSINQPKFKLVKNLAEIDNIAKEFQKFPIVLKPLTSINAKKANTKKRLVQKVYNEENLISKLSEMLKDGSVLAQENFIGIGCGVEVLAQNGKILTAFQHERVHEPIFGGGSSYRKSSLINPDLFNATEKLMAKLNYTGVAMVEFKINVETNEWILVEINGRFWGSLPLAVSSGIDFPHYLYQMLIEDKTRFNQEYIIDTYCRNIIKDLAWFKSNLYANHNDPTLMTKKWKDVFKEFAHSFSGRAFNDTITKDDPSPGVLEITDLILDKFKKLIICTKNMLPRDKKKSQTRFHSASNVLFICKGNICRSPYAAIAAKKHFPEKQIINAGTFRAENRSSPENARIARPELKTHQSKSVTLNMVENSDIIIIFDRHNEFTLRKLYPQAKNKILYFNDLNKSVDKKELSDPYGQDISAFEKTYNDIDSVISGL